MKRNLQIETLELKQLRTTNADSVTVANCRNDFPRRDCCGSSSTAMTVTDQITLDATDKDIADGADNGAAIVERDPRMPGFRLGALAHLPRSGQ